MNISKSELEQEAEAASWFHSIDLGQGVVTRGHKTPEILTREIAMLNLPNLEGKTVLDINCWDGFFAFEAERRGAARVVALDQYMWAMDMKAHGKYWRESTPDSKPYHETDYYDPINLPGQAGYNLAHKALGSRVETVVADFMKVDSSTLGIFDVVFYLGSLYHMENPLEAMRRLAAVTGEVAIIETQAIAVPGYEDHALCEFYPTNELNNDSSNWWAPNEKALLGLCRAAGFKRAEARIHAPQVDAAKRLRTKLRYVFHAMNLMTPPLKVEYRAVVHAFK